MLTKEEVQKLKTKYDRHAPNVLASANDIENLILTIQKQWKEISELKLNVMISVDAHKDEIQRRRNSDKEIKRLTEIIEENRLPRHPCVDCGKEESNPNLDVCGLCYNERIRGKY